MRPLAYFLPLHLVLTISLPSRRDLAEGEPATKEGLGAERSSEEGFVAFPLLPPLSPPNLPFLPFPAAEGGSANAVAVPVAAPRRIVQMPDEYLPPNKILFVQQLPDDTTKEGLEALFRPYVFSSLPFSPCHFLPGLPRRPLHRPILTPPPRSYANLIEVRTIPGRKNIAFVEFADEHSSSVARDALHNSKFSGTTGATSDEGLKIKVTFAKKG